MIFSPSFIFRKENFDINLDKFLNTNKNQKIVLNLWHIETFEGGSSSREKFLEKCAIKFNNINSNCLIYVKTLTAEQLVLNLQDGKTADMFSFGVGAGCYLTGFLDELKNPKNVRENLLDYSTLSNKIYAYPYISSGYCLISKSYAVMDSLQETLKEKKINNKSIIGTCFASKENINPFEVLKENNIKNMVENKDIYLVSSTYNAYTEFINKKTATLLGTTRDLIRCKNREENGALESCNYKFFNEYSDLIQYIGVNKNISKTKLQMAQEFSLFLTEDNCQRELKNYSLFSTSNNKIYSVGFLSDFENSLIKLKKSINVFSSIEKIEEEKQISKQSIFS